MEIRLVHRLMSKLGTAIETHTGMQRTNSLRADELQPLLRKGWT
jgi:hypothetical protein